ncbi:MAG: hypothetical protein ACRCT7_03440 [Shewanella sp.]
MTTIKQLLLRHICKYCAQNKLEINDDTVSEDLNVLLERIDAPESLRGFNRLVLLIETVNKHCSASAKIIKESLLWPDYIFTALQAFSISYQHNEKAVIKEYYLNSYQKGWCSEHPFYVVLLKINLNNESSKLFAAFIKQYFLVLDKLRDSLRSKDLDTGIFIREGQVCSSFRLFMTKSSPSLNPIKGAIQGQSKKAPDSIANDIERFLEKDDISIKSNERNYLRILVHFFRNDWETPRVMSRKKSSSERVPKQYLEPLALPVLGDPDEMFTLMRPQPLMPDQAGLDEDDQYVLQEFVIHDRHLSAKRDPTELLDTAIPFNKYVQSRLAVDVTAKVRRSQNMGLQNTQLLMEAELDHIISTLITLAKKKSWLDITIVIWLMMLLSKSIVEIQALIVFTDLSKKQPGLYIDKDGKGWWFFSVTHQAKRTQEHTDLREAKEDVFTPCPDFLLKLIIENVGVGYNGPIIKEINQQVITEKIRKKLKKISDLHVSGRFSVRRLVNFVSSYLNSTDLIDPIFIDYSYNVQMYTTRVARSYANISDQYRCNQLDCLWQRVKNDIEGYTGKQLPFKLFELRYFHQNDQFMGSSFIPTELVISELINTLVNKIEASKPSFHYRLVDIVNYHNAFAAYTAWMLLFGTGYRAAWNPLPTFALFMPSLNLMGISDKDDSDFTHSRIVAVPTVLKLQIIEYKRHLSCLRALLRVLYPKLCHTIDNIVEVDNKVLSFNNLQASDWYKVIRNSRTELGPFFFIEKQQRGGFLARNLSPSELAKFCGKDIVLPYNVGRHWLKSELLAKNVPSELINFQMGHWQAGEVPLGNYSALRIAETIPEILPVLDELLGGGGWKPIKSVFS